MIELMRENILVLLVVAVGLIGLLVLLGRDPMLSGHPRLVGGIAVALAAAVAVVLAGGYLSGLATAGA